MSCSHWHYQGGRWLTAEHAENLLQGKLIIEPRQLRAGDRRRLKPRRTGARRIRDRSPEPCIAKMGSCRFKTDAALTRRASDRAINVDVIFPVLHGTFGEDGTIQGLLELADIAYGARACSARPQHGQGHHEILVHRRWNTDCEACHYSAQRMGERSEETEKS